MNRTAAIAMHEAAHVVVGVALGCKLHRAVVLGAPDGNGIAGWAWFPDAPPSADKLITAAGVAWSDATNDGLDADDARELRKLVRYKRRDFRVCVLAAQAILEARAPVHLLVTRALLEQDLTQVDIEALAAGVSPTKLRDD